jgi:hypothetical protein
MSILKISTPSWISQGQTPKQPVEQQRTIIPAQKYAQGLQLNQGNKTDSVPAMLRPGEEVITPETTQAMGGRDQLMDALNTKLRPRGLSLSGGQGPVQGGKPESQFTEGTAGGMRSAYRGGTIGISYRQGYAKGTQQPFQTSPSFIPGGVTMNSSTPGIQSMPPTDFSRKKLAGGTAGVPRMIDQVQSLITGGVSDRAKEEASEAVAPTKTTTAVASPVVLPKVPQVPQTPETTNATDTTASPGVTAAPISNQVKGIGFQVTPLTQSAYYKEPAMRLTETLQKQNAVANQQQAQNLAQQSVPATSAAAHTLTAEQQANQESNMVGAQAQIAESAANKIQSDLKNTMQMAYNTGNWETVNKILASTGQQPIDFTNLEKDRQAGNLTGVAQNLITMANSITGTDAGSITTKAALMQEGMGLISTSAKTVLGAQYNPESLSNAVTNIQSGNVTDPATQAFITHVAPTISSWVTDTVGGQTFTSLLEDNSNPAGLQLSQKAASGDEQAIATLSTLAVYAAARASGGLNDNSTATKRARALLVQYGVDIDFNTISNVENVNQEGVPGTSAQIGNMLAGGTNPSEAGQNYTTSA